VFARLIGQRRAAARLSQQQRYTTISEFATLEQRLLMAAQPASASAEHRVVYEGAITVAQSAAVAAGTVVKNTLSAIPSLNSYPTAIARIYLDFVGDAARTWGDYRVTATPAYDRDGDSTTFTNAELTAIREIWQRVAEKYSPFNINVTTVNPGTLDDRRVMRVVIGGDGAWSGQSCGGLSYVGSFYNSDPNTSYVFPENLAGGEPNYVAEAAAHEAGHGFGLEHQSQYDSRGHVVEEYYAGDGDVAPLMGNSYDATRGLWWNGTTTSPTTRQDDMAVLAGTNNGFGYRVDDHANTIGSADALRVVADAVSGSGVIEKTSDADYFSFTTGAGMVNFSIDTAAIGPMLDLKAELIKSDGTVVATADTYSLGEELSADLEAGSYRLVVKSNGLYGDVGQYVITGTIVPVDIAAPQTPTGVSATAKPGERIWVAWDAQNAAEQYIVERSVDGVQWDTAAIVAAGTTGCWDKGLTAGKTYYYRVVATNAGGTSAASDAVSAVALAGTAPSAPSGLRVSALAPYRLKLSWVDKSDNETGFRIQWSADGTKWYTLGRMAANRTSVNLTVMRRGRTYFRVSAFNPYGESSFSEAGSALTGAASKRGQVKKAEPVFSITQVKGVYDS